MDTVQPDRWPFGMNATLWHCECTLCRHHDEFVCSVRTSLYCHNFEPNLSIHVANADIGRVDDAANGKLAVVLAARERHRPRVDVTDLSNVNVTCQHVRSSYEKWRYIRTLGLHRRSTKSLRTILSPTRDRPSPCRCLEKFERKMYKPNLFPISDVFQSW